MNGFTNGPRAAPGGWDDSNGTRDHRGIGENIPHLSDITAYVEHRVEELRLCPVCGSALTLGQAHTK